MSPTNLQFRFSEPFIREVIYQRIAFKFRRPLHLQVAEAIKSMQKSEEDDEETQGERLVYHWYLGEPLVTHNFGMSEVARRNRLQSCRGSV